MKGFRMSISERFFGIGESSEMQDGEPATNDVKDWEMSEDRLTEADRLSARLSNFERRIAQLELWTGADENGHWDENEMSVTDRLRAQDAIITHLFRYLELLVPGFSIAQFRSDLHVLDERLREFVQETDPDAEPLDPMLLKRDRRIIDQCLPKSLYDDGGKPTGPFPADFLALLRARSSRAPEEPSDA